MVEFEEKFLEIEKWRDFGIEEKQIEIMEMEFIRLELGNYVEGGN